MEGSMIYDDDEERFDLDWREVNDAPMVSCVDCRFAVDEGDEHQCDRCALPLCENCKKDNLCRVCRQQESDKS